MPTLISHRGNLFGPNIDRENDPEYLLEAIYAGFDVEVDVWVYPDTDGYNLICFGHDSPQHCSIPESFLLEIGHAAWFHCKNLDALYFFNSVFPQLNYFWHQTDDYTLTSQGYIWTYPGKDITGNSVIVDLNKDIQDYSNVFGICGDYVGVSK